MTRMFKFFVFIFSFSFVNNVLCQVDTSNYKNKDIQKEAIEIREKIKNFMNQKLLIEETPKPKEQKLVSQTDQLFLLQNAFDTLLSIVYNQNKQIDTLSLKLLFLEDYIGLNGKLKKNNAKKKNITTYKKYRDNTITFFTGNNNIRIVNSNTLQTNTYTTTDSVTLVFENNAYKLNYISICTLDSLLPFLKNNNIILNGYFDNNGLDSNFKYLVNLRVNDVKLYLESKGLKPSLITTELINVYNTQNINFDNKVNVVFSK